MSKEGLLYKYKEKAGKLVIWVFGILIDFFDRKIVFANPDAFAGVKNLENHFPEILHELNLVLNERNIPGIDDFFEEQKKIAEKKSWKSFPLFVYGNEFQDNTKLCPKTRAVLLDVKGMSSAMFSILSAGKIIPPHKGPYKGVLRVHLGLVIPLQSEKLCYIEVDNQRKEWTKGKVMVFDDTHTHAAYNYTKEDRAVLFIDIIRPLPFPLNFVNRFIFNRIAESPFISGTLEGYKQYGNTSFSKIKLCFE